MSKYDPYVVDDNESSCEEVDDEENEDDDDDEDINTLETKPALGSLFSSVVEMGGGNFTCGGALQSNFGLPGLEIIIPKSSSDQSSSSASSSSEQFEYKPIALPIVSKEQANELISQCSKAPFGKGEETIYDDKVRNSWQLSPSQFRISNKNWNVMLNELMNGELKRGLGINENVKIKCSLYKLLLYEEGGHFEFHRDTEKEDQMFATLVIQLPSVYKGGNIIVKHGSNEEVYDLSNESSYTPFYFSFYCDCKHKVDVVTSGYRTCLIYNVCYVSGSKPIITDNTSLVTTFNEIVNNWSLSTPILCYLLGHKYSKAGLSFDCLKGSDTKILQLIRQYNAKHSEQGIEVFLAMMTKTESGYGDPYNIEWEETSYSITHMIDESGHIHSNTNNLDLDESDFFPEDALEELEQSGEEIEEHTGNEGATASRWYKSACLIIYPKRFKYLMALKFGGSSAYKGLQDLWEDYLKDASLRNQLVQYLKSFIEKTYSRYMVGNFSIGNYISELRELNLAKLLLSQYKCSKEDVIQMVSAFGIDPLRNEIIGYFKNMDFNSLAEFLDVFPDNNLAQLLIPTLLTNDRYSYRSNSSTDYETALAACSKYNITLDSETKKKILSDSSYNTTQLYQLGCKLKDIYCLMEVLKRSFSISLNSNRFYLNSNTVTPPATLPVKIIVNCIQIIGLDNCRATLEQLISEFVNRNGISSSLDSIQLFSDNTDNIHVSDFISKSIVKNIKARNDLKSQNIDIYEKIFIQFYKCGAIDEMSDLAKLLISNPNSQYIHSTINPLVLKISRANINVINSEPLQFLIRKCIQYYDSVITNQSNVPTPNNWVINATLGCTCGNCKSCNEFLKSATQVTHSIKASASLRDHVERESRKVTIDLQYDTLRQGSPHTLVLTKIRKSQELKQRALQESITSRNNLTPLVRKAGASTNDPPSKKLKSEH